MSVLKRGFKRRFDPEGVMVYNLNIPVGAEIMEVPQFIQYCRAHTIMDEDGSAHPVNILGKMAAVYVYPSRLIFPKDATHIAWFIK